MDSNDPLTQADGPADESPAAGPSAPPSPASPAVWCANCAALVEPDERGACPRPRCRRFLPENTGALTLGLRSKRIAKVVDAYRVGLLEQLFQERGGREALDVVSRIAIENYALVCAQHKTIETRLDQDGLFTQTGRRRSAFDMLKAISETIDRLRAALPPPLASTNRTPEEFAKMTNDQLIAYLEGLLAQVRERGDEERRLKDAAAISALELAGAARFSEGDIAPAPAAPTPTLTCGYSCGTLERCAELKARRPEIWAALHYTDPEEIKRREKAATDEMFKQVGQPLPDWLGR